MLARALLVGALLVGRISGRIMASLWAGLVVHLWLDLHIRRRWGLLAPTPLLRSVSLVLEIPGVKLVEIVEHQGV